MADCEEYIQSSHVVGSKRNCYLMTILMKRWGEQLNVEWKRVD
jgi:hypothetical protein